MNKELLQPFRTAPERAGIFTDFDGTLSRIVHRPSDARPMPGAREILARLARHFALVSVVSGRSAADLLEWLGDDIEIWESTAQRPFQRDVWCFPRGPLPTVN